MTIDRTQAVPPADPESDDDQAARVTEPAASSSLSRLAAWIRHAPAERAPALGIPAAWTAAEILHAAGTSPVFTGAATLAAAGIAYGVGERRIREEARHATSGQPEIQAQARIRIGGAELAAVAGGLGLWATAAAVWGPLAGPFDLLTVLYGAGAVGGYWWLRSHEAVRAARARRDAAAAAEAEAEARAAEWLARRAEWHQLAALVGLNGSHLMAIEPNLNGEAWAIDLYSTRKLASEIDCRRLAQRLAGERGTRRGRVEVTADPEWPYRLAVFWRAGDPWQGGSADAYIWHPWASGEYNAGAPFAELAPRAPSILDPLGALGADPETGTPLELPLFGDKGAERVLLIAPSGSGKSMLLDTIRERITACPDARLLQINLSKGVEDSWWEPLTEASALATDENPGGHALAILDFLTAAYKGRPQAAARKAGARWHRPTPAEPAFVLIIDEYDEVSKDPARRQAVESLLSKVRSEAIPVILATQRPAGKWVSTSIKANVSRIVWAKMRAGDARHLAGNEGFELPDMGAYGGDNAGIFGVAGHPTYAGMPFLRGRAFFWGDDSRGMLRLISARAAGRRPYVLEPALAHLADLWEKAAGTAPLSGPGDDDDRYDVTTTRDGTTVPGVAHVKARLASTAALLGGTRPGPQGGPGQERAAEPGPGGPPGHQGGPEPGTGPEGPGDSDEAALATLRELVARPGGVSRGEAVDALPWQKTKTHLLLARLRDEEFAVQRGEGRGARYYAAGQAPPEDPYPPLRSVPDPPPEASGGAP